MADLGDVAIGLVGAGAALAGVWLDGQRRDTREREQQRERVQTAARLVLAEMVEIEDSIERALRENSWGHEQELSAERWLTYSPALVNQIDPGDFAKLTVAYRWVQRLSLGAAQRLTQRQWIVLDTDPEFIALARTTHRVIAEHQSLLKPLVGDNF